MKVLETERLTLRWFDEGDAPFILELLNDPDWIANIGDRNIHTVEEARAWIVTRLVASYWQKGHGLWAMERRSDGVPVGMCGLIERDTLPAIDVGYALAPAFRGSGYAREATRACLAYAREVLGKARVLAIVSPANRASIHVLESAGMAAEGVRVLEGESRETAVFGWGEGLDRRDDRAEIDSLASRFFRSFVNRGVAVPTLAAIPSFFLTEAVVTVVRAGEPRGVVVSNVRDFVVPRAALLLDGLRDFDEHEVTSETTITGSLAHRASHYRKSGMLDGTAFEGEGRKHFQLVRTTRGWKVAALVWEDGPAAG